MNQSIKKVVRKFIAKLSTQETSCQIYSLQFKSKKKHHNVSTSTQTNLTNNNNTSATAQNTSGKDVKGQPPVCLWKPHKEKVCRHYMKYFRNCPQRRNNNLLKDLKNHRKGNMSAISKKE